MSVFSKILVTNPQYNSFDLSFDTMLSCNAGYIIPIGIQETIPGDVVNLNTQIFFRLAPLASPLYSELVCYQRSFYIPTRLCYKRFTEFIGEPKNRTVQRPELPKIRISDFTNTDYVRPGSLLDYLGYPVDASGTYKGQQYISALPFIAYQLCYNEYFINELVEDPIDFDAIVLGNGGVLSTNICKELLTLRKAPWRRDYFTSCSTQVGSGKDVLLPVAGDIEFTFDSSNGTSAVRSPSGTPATQGNISIEGGSVVDSSGRDVAVDITDNITGKFKNALATIPDLRRSIALQKCLELASRAGRRYKEQIFAFFGVDVKDSRVDRPEYLGGAKVPVIVQDVTQTSETSNTPLGTLAGKGVGAGQSYAKYTCREHGYLLHVIYIVPKSMYSQGINKMFTRFDKYDYYFPQFSKLGDMPVYNKELYAADDGQNDVIFGYTPRNADYKYHGGEYHGAFRNTLLNWHLGRQFVNRPGLNSDFLHVDPADVNRVFAFQGNYGFYDDDGIEVFSDENDVKIDERGNTLRADPSINHHFWIQAHVGQTMQRKMPIFGDPDQILNI